MADKRIQWGTIDKRALHSVIEANTQATAIGLAVLDAQSLPEVYQLMTRMGFVLSQQRDALSEMQRIRSEVKRES